jgi:Skp family chaperone for outer membrane proteins
MGARIFATAAILAMVSTPALAGQCPADIKAINAGLTTINLDSAKKAEVMALRAARLVYEQLSP